MDITEFQKDLQKVKDDFKKDISKLENKITRIDIKLETLKNIIYAQLIVQREVNK